MGKEKDLKKAIEEIKDSMKENDLESLKGQLLSKINSGSNMADLLKDDTLQETLQAMLKNKNVANLLQNPEITSQLSAVLNSNNNQGLIEQLKELLSSEKKK